MTYTRLNESRMQDFTPTTNFTLAKNASTKNNMYAHLCCRISSSSGWGSSSSGWIAIASGVPVPLSSSEVILKGNQGGWASAVIIQGEVRTDGKLYAYITSAVSSSTNILVDTFYPIA